MKTKMMTMIMTCSAFDAAADILMLTGWEILQCAFSKAASGLVFNYHVLHFSNTSVLSNMIVSVLL